MNYGVNINLDCYLYVDANNKEEAIEKVRNMSYDKLMEYLSKYSTVSIGDDVIEDDE